MDWKKVKRCKHKNLSPDYLGHIYCDTPYCEGSEDHCLDCGVFISTCGCGSNNGMSGWPNVKWERYNSKKHQGFAWKLLLKGLTLV
jgi:hypothetical protein